VKSSSVLPDNRRGFSLLEAAVAVAIVGIAAAGALTAFGAEFRTADQAKQGLIAASLATARLATVRLLSRGELNPIADSLARRRFAPPFDRYRWEVALKELSGRADLFEAQVAVYWDGGVYRLKTRLYRPRPQAQIP
jgi:prepilin-type N-terminal cleavage/methylation domain-containing protein